MKELSRSIILKLHAKTIARFGGSLGIRDEKMLDSALNAPFQTFDGIDFYPTLLEKAARLGYGIVQNHPFVDGNKRVGALAALVLLKLNGKSVKASSEELAPIILRIAKGEAKYEDFRDWLLARTFPQ
ncbi:MAG: type II toxin-antitoxin system death-on-curing family toxin [Thermoguttaceae bacterium]|nr:type II toxin-antitoxin system death-on-curing family toxin [Thermoguttaceae bacterium]